MKYRTLLKSQANEILNEIKRYGLNPSDFEWVEVKSNVLANQPLVNKLVYTDTVYFFTFDTEFAFEYSPAREQLVLQIKKYKTWQDVLRRVGYWLEFLKREIEAPNLWETIKQESELLTATTSKDDNAQFNKDELDKIHSGIAELKSYLIDAQNVDKAIVEPRLKYLVEASERNGRKDWLNIFYSVVIGIILNSYVSPESAKEIMGFIGATFEVLFSNQTPLLK